MKSFARAAVSAFLLLGLAAAARSEQPWEWRTPSVPGRVFPTKAEAAAAMRASDPKMAVLTTESEAAVSAGQQVFTCSALDVAAAYTHFLAVLHPAN